MFRGGFHQPWGWVTEGDVALVFCVVGSMDTPRLGPTAGIYGTATALVCLGSTAHADTNPSVTVSFRH